MLRLYSASKLNRYETYSNIHQKSNNIFEYTNILYGLYKSGFGMVKRIRVSRSLLFQLFPILANHVFTVLFEWVSVCAETVYWNTAYRIAKRTEKRLLLLLLIVNI